MDTSDHQRSRSGCEWLDRHKICVGEESLYLQLGRIHYGSGSQSVLREPKGSATSSHGSVDTFV